MQKITVVFKDGGGSFSFDVADAKIHTSNEEETYGKLVGYEFVTTDTYTSLVWFEPSSVAGILAISDELVKPPEKDEVAGG